MATESTKRPLSNWQFAWFASKKDGKLRMVVGPDALEVTDDDIPLKADATSPSGYAFAASAAEAIQQFVVVGSDEYVVLRNPNEPFEDEFPNGKYSTGAKNEMKNPVFGAKRIVTRGSFPLWPGQHVERRKVHRLRSNEYVVVEIENGVVDTKAPYYELLLACAAIKEAVVHNTAAPSTVTTVAVTQVAATPSGIAPTNGTGDHSEGAPNQPPHADGATAAGILTEKVRNTFEVGQRIVVTGAQTPSFIPPTGTEIVPDDNGKLIRSAVVLGSAQYCVLVNADGCRQTKSGPGRIFPGPNDSFYTNGSKDRVYEAYHLRVDRGLLLRVVAPELTARALLAKLPPGVKLDAGKESFHRGDEVFVGELDAYLAPDEGVEVIDPLTHSPHVGNDHSMVYVRAIGVDQKSGVYVADVGTGNITLVKGEKKLLLDPRKSRHVERKVPAEEWNRIIARNAPHKEVAEGTLVTTPWALSVSVPNNEAVLVTSRNGRRAVLGPCTELLQFEETLEVLSLSRGCPKGADEDDALATCFLRVKGNRISDEIELVTSDLVTIKVKVAYGVTFTGATADERASWFGFPDYVMMLCRSMRSRLRAAAQSLGFTALHAKLSDFVRDVVLGAKPAGEGTHRTGRLFAENNMLVDEVDIVSIVIPDATVAKALAESQARVVTYDIQNATANAELAFKQRKEALDAEGLKVITATEVRAKAAELESARRKDLHDAEVIKLTTAAEERAKAAQLEAEKRKDEFNAELAKLAASAAARAQDEANAENARKVAALGLATTLAEATNANDMAIVKAREEQANATSLRKRELDRAVAEVQRQIDKVRAESEAEIEKIKSDAAKVRAEIEIAVEKDKHERAEAHARAMAEIEKMIVEAGAEADVKRLGAIQPGLIAAIEGHGDKAALAELAKHLPPATGPMLPHVLQGGISALQDYVKGSPFGEALNSLTGKQ